MYCVVGHMNRNFFLTEEDAVLIRIAGFFLGGGGGGGGKIFMDSMICSDSW